MKKKNEQNEMMDEERTEENIRWRAESLELWSPIILCLQLEIPNLSLHGLHLESLTEIQIEKTFSS